MAATSVSHYALAVMYRCSTLEVHMTLFYRSHDLSENQDSNGASAGTSSQIYVCALEEIDSLYPWFEDHHFWGGQNRHACHLSPFACVFDDAWNAICGSRALTLSVL